MTIGDTCCMDVKYLSHGHADGPYRKGRWNLADLVLYPPPQVYHANILCQDGKDGIDDDVCPRIAIICTSISCTQGTPFQRHTKTKAEPNKQPCAYRLFFSHARDTGADHDCIRETSCLPQLNWDTQQRCTFYVFLISSTNSHFYLPLLHIPKWQCTKWQVMRLPATRRLWPYNNRTHTMMTWTRLAGFRLVNEGGRQCWDKHDHIDALQAHGIWILSGQHSLTC